MKPRILPILLLSMVLILSVAVKGMAAPTISLQSLPEQVKPGDEFTLEVFVSDIQGLFGVSFEIQYDGNILDYVEASSGDFLGNDVIFLDMAGDNSVSIAVTMKGGATAASGSGIIANITFLAKAEGASSISYRQDTLSLQTADGSPIQATVEDETVTVTGTPAPAPAIHIVPSKDEAEVGEQFPVEIKLENIANLFAVSFELQFDGTVLKAVDAVSGELLGTDVVQIAVPDDGSISVGISLKAGADSVDGSGVVAIVTFEAIGEGETDISFKLDKIELKTADDTSIDGFDALTAGSANVSANEPSLVYIGKMILTWGRIKLMEMRR